MSRVKRLRSMSGIYHVMLRGVNKSAIFHDDQDRMRMLEVIDKVKALVGFELFAYCLMHNHVHLLIKETEEEPIGSIMKRISVRYVMWFNRKYERVGHLFQDRYKSECVDEQAYYLVVLRYILQNPIKAGVVSRLDAYPWSSYHENIDHFDKPYLRPYLRTSMRLSTDFWQDTMAYNEFMSLPSEEDCLDLNCNSDCLDEEVLSVYSDLLVNQASQSHYQVNKVYRDQCIKEVKEMFDISIRELSQILGLGKSIIERAVR